MNSTLRSLLLSGCAETMRSNLSTPSMHVGKFNFYIGIKIGLTKILIVK